MFEGDFSDMCGDKFPLVLKGGWARTPIGTLNFGPIWKYPVFGMILNLKLYCTDSNQMFNQISKHSQFAHFLSLRELYNAE
jgi:hypothetical protein